MDYDKSVDHPSDGMMYAGKLDGYRCMLYRPDGMESPTFIKFGYDLWSLSLYIYIYIYIYMDIYIYIYTDICREIEIDTHIYVGRGTRQ